LISKTQLFGALLTAWVAGAMIFASATQVVAASPERIVSINLCADQVLLALDPGKRLVAVSSLASDPNLSVFHETAATRMSVRASLEDVVRLEPDLVVAGTFGHGRLVAQLERMGVDVLRVPDATTLEEIRQTYLDVGDRLGMPAKARALADTFDTALGAEAPRSLRSALIVSPGLLVHGDTMLGGDVLTHAGMSNAAGARVYLSLEDLVAELPDTLIVAQSDAAAPSRANKLFAHPALTRSLASSDTLRVPASVLICGTVETARLAARLAARDVRLEVQ